MSDEGVPSSEIILYRTEDGRSRIECRFEEGTIWLTQAQMAALFQTTPQNITQHLRQVYAEGELNEAATCKDFLQVRSEGGREARRSLRHYGLPTPRFPRDDEVLAGTEEDRLRPGAHFLTAWPCSPPPRVRD